MPKATSVSEKPKMGIPATVVNNLKDLPVEILREVSDYALLLASEAKPGPHDRHEQVLYAALTHHLSPILGDLLPLHVFRKTDLYVRFKMVRRSFDKFGETCKMTNLTLPERKTWYDILVGLLTERAKVLDAPLSLKLILNQSEFVPGLFENAFPGYIQAGFVRRVLL